MMECQDLCTAAKCQELENELDALRDLVHILQSTLDIHLDQEIPQAHKYNSNIKIEGSYENNGVNLSISDVTSTDSAFIELPFVLQEDFDEHINKKIPEAHEFDLDFDINIDVGFVDNKILVSVDLDINQQSKTAQDEAEIKVNNLSLEIGGSYENNGLNLTITDGTSTDSTFIELPFVTTEDFQEHKDTEIPNAHKYIPKVDVNIFESPEAITIQVLVDNEAGSDEIMLGKCDVNIDLQPILDAISKSFSGINTAIDRVSDNLDREGNNIRDNSDRNRRLIEDGENRTQQLIIDKFNDLDLSEIVTDFAPILNLLNEIKTTLETDFSGELELGSCEVITKDEDGNSIPPTQRYSSIGGEVAKYAGKGLSGINKQLTAIDRKLTEINKNACSFVYDVGSIDVKDLLKNCSPEPLSEREDFRSDDEYINYLSDLVDLVLPPQIRFLKNALKSIRTGGTEGNPIEETVNTIFRGSIGDLLGVSTAVTQSGQTEICELISGLDCVASVPEWWQIRPEADRPQLILHFAETREDSKKLGKAIYALTIPHVSGYFLEKPKRLFDLFEDKVWKKGNFQTVLILKDNSKLIYNSKNKSEANQMLELLTLIIRQDYIKDSIVKLTEIKNLPFKEITVKPKVARYYRTGLKNNLADLSIDFTKGVSQFE